MKGSHVPQKSLKQRHATYTPDTIQPINRHPLDCSKATQSDPVLMSPDFSFDASSVVRLRSSHRFSPDASCDAFSLTLTTLALNQSRLGRFKASPCRAALEGLPPSLPKVTALSETSLSRSVPRGTQCVEKVRTSKRANFCQIACFTTMSCRYHVGLNQGLAVETSPLSGTPPYRASVNAA